MPDHIFGTALTEADYQNLAACGISRATADAAPIRRVDEVEGREVVGREKRDLGESFAGLLFGTRWPGRNGVRDYYLRRDHPPKEQKADGTFKEKQKYIAAPGSYNNLFLPPGGEKDWLIDPSLDLIITEGPKKTLAVSDLMWRDLGDAADRPRALVVGISGAWSFRGKRGRQDGPKGESVPIKGIINDLDNLTLKNRKITLVYDADVNTNDDIKHARNSFAKELRERGAQVLFVDIPVKLGLKGIDDVIGQAGPDKALEIIGSAYDPRKKKQRKAGATAFVNTPSEEWQSNLLLDSNQQILQRVENFRVCFSENPSWKGAIQFDEFRNRVVITDAAPVGIPRGFLSDHAEIAIRCWCDRYFIPTGKEMVHDAIEFAAHEHIVHSVRDYLRGLPPWEGKVKPETFFQTYFGAKAETEDMKTYLARVAIMFMVSAIARIFEPGVQVDYMIVLEGWQGIAKSSALRALFGSENFTDQMPKLDGKEASQQLDGKWCIEFGEIARLIRQDPDTVKAFISRQVDTYRRPYGHVPGDWQRQTVFAGTVNEDEYLVDEENRRFWSVHCDGVDVEAIKRDRDQIWAAFLKLYNDKVHWWPEDNDLRRIITLEQKKRKVEIPYYATIAEWLVGQTQAIETSPSILTTEYILDRCLDIRFKAQWPSVTQHVSKVMRDLGYKGERETTGLRLRYWKKKEEQK